MKKLRLMASRALLATSIILAVSTYSTNIKKIYVNELETHEIKLVKLANEVNELRLGNSTEEKSEKETTNKIVKDASNKSIKETSVKKVKETTGKKVKEKSGKKNKRKKTKNKKHKEEYEYVGQFKVTAYCSCASCCGKCTGITASGTRATAGRTIAADASRFSFGTQLKIGDHTYTVEDRGGAIKGNKIDIYFDSHSAALQWGVKYCDVFAKRK